jgi:ligand-binding sensor domain-containing protein
MPGTPASVPVGPGYDIQYRRVKVAPAAGGLIGRAYTPSLVGAFDACIRAGEARTVTVAYTLEPGSERLWASAINAPTAQAAAFAPSSLSSGMQLPTVGQSYGATRVQDLAIDAFGNLWVADGAKLLMFGYGKLGASGQPAPDLTVTGAAVKAAQALAFDAVGNLWIANGGATPTLDLIRVTDLLTTAATVAPAPAVTIGSPALVDPKALAFDVDENLWIASAGNDSVLQLKAARLAASAPATAPDTTLTAAQLNPGTATVMRDHKAPWSLAFDKFGNLWVGFNGSSDIVRFTLADLSTVGAKRIDNPLAKKFTAASLKGLAFDETGGLWFSLKSGMGDFGRLPAADLAASGEAHPDVLITSNVLNTPERILLDPVPMGLPIRD